MPLRHLVVTPLPNGRSGNTLFLSVHLSPRLREDGVLADYSDFADWGSFVQSAPALQFQPRFNGAPRPGVTVTTTSPPVDPDVWRAVFGDPPTNVAVRRFAFRDRSDINLAAIDSGELSEWMLALVRAISALGAANATKADVIAAAGPLFAELLPPAHDFFDQVGNGRDPAPPSDEFHDQLGPLCAHPYLMRALGLVFDLEITMPAGAGVITHVAVSTNWPQKTGLSPHDEVPMGVAVDTDFRAVVNQTQYRESDWLSLGGPKYAIGQLDMINATSQMGQLVDDLVAAPAPTSSIEVPALLESGLSVICGDLGDVLRERFERQRAIEDGIDKWLTNAPNSPPPTLSAEEITLGYRCDVNDLTAAGYRSLHDRQVPAGYGFPRAKSLQVDPPPDEGWGSIALSTDGSEVHLPKSTNITYHQEGAPTVTKVEELDQTAWRVDDHIITWGGWSLSTPRVGNSTTGAGEVKPRELNVPANGYATQLLVDYAHVNGTLPKLRYGRTYTFRGRCVDLAGNGPGLGDAPPPDGESAPTQFGRLAPLVPPLPIRRESRPDPGVGDLPDVLVIKSELRQSNRNTPPTDRLLFPPRVSQSRLERHDLPSGGNDPASYAFIAECDALSLADQTIVDPETGELVAGAALVDGNVTPGPTKPPVGYLVDPVAGHVALIGLPGGDPDVPVLMTYGNWPNSRAVQLELRAGNGAPLVSQGQRRIRVRLPKGTVVTAELSTAPDTDLLEHMALGQKLDDKTTEVAHSGLNRSMSPRRQITFVHAVRLPLLPPSFGPMTATRTDVGQTDVVIDGTLGVHRATTEHVVLRSRWKDPIDDPALDHLALGTPVQQVTKRVIIDVPIPLDGDDDADELAATSLELGDTKRRTVDVIAQGFCRFSRYFTERIDFITGAPGNTLVLNEKGVVLSSVVLTRPDSGERFVRGVHFDVDRDTGELSILDTTTIPQGATCRVEFIPLPVSRLSLKAATGKKFTFDVPSSAAPDLPSVVGVLPAFSRQVRQTASRITVVHDGRVLRLHLDRPWFSSGAGELLGVAIDSQGESAPSLTRWGRDPLTAGTGATLDPTVASFPNSSEVATGVDGRFDVAGHDVAFDAERKLWIADVLVDAQFGYRPFAQLHVCRYQPLALDAQHVSATVELAPLRLGASRRVVVSQQSANQVRVRLTGPDNVNLVAVVLQEADSTIADPDLRWHDVSTTPLARSGTTSAAVHAGLVSIPQTGNERRLVVEDSERVTVESESELAEGAVVAYREVIPIPPDW